MLERETPHESHRDERGSLRKETPLSSPLLRVPVTTPAAVLVVVGRREHQSSRKFGKG